MSDKLISVIVAAYNAEKYLHRCLDSILDQPYQNVEAMIMDDGSKDSTLAIANEYAVRDSRVRVFSQKNKGPAEARNTLIELSKGDYIAICDADDYNCRDRFVNQAGYLDEHPDVDLVSGGCAKITEAGRVVFASKNRRNSKYDKMILTGVRNPVPHGGVMFRKEVVNRIDKPFYRKVVGEDVEVLARLLYAGCRFAYTDGFVYYYQLGSSLQESYYKNVIRDKEREVIAKLVADGDILDGEKSAVAYAQIPLCIRTSLVKKVNFKIVRFGYWLFAKYVWCIWPRVLRRFVYDLAFAYRFERNAVLSYDEIEMIDV